METRKRFNSLFLVISACLAIGLIDCGGGGGSGGIDLNFTLNSFIAVDDLNNDGLDDIVVTKIHIFAAPPHPGYVAVLLQDPDAPGSFLPVKEYPVGRDPEYVAISDINNDTFPDLITVNSNSDYVSILLQNLNTPGNFLNAVNIPTENYPNSAAAVDLNNDGVQDLAVCCGSILYLHYQDPDHPLSFLPAENITIPPGGNCSDISIVDIDSNGLDDLVVANDGEFDISTISSSGGSVYIFLQDELSPGSFLSAYSFPAGDTTQPIFVAGNDLNKDGLPDLAVVNYGTPSNGSSAGVAILLQDPDNPGAFLGPDYYATGDRSVAIAISDLNADGWADLAVSNRGALITDCDWLTDNCSYDVNGTISVLLQNPVLPGSFLPAHNLVGVDQYSGVAIGDLNGDLRPDIAIAAERVPVLFQDPADPGEFFGAIYVESGSHLP